MTTARETCAGPVLIPMRRPLLAAVAAASLALALAGCGQQGPPLERADAVPTAPTTTSTTAPPVPVFTVAHVVGKSIPVFDAPGAAAPARTMSNPNEEDAPRVFLVRSQQPGW